MHISVVIPCYDLSRELEKTLAGLLTQNQYPASWEVIIVDLNSRADSLEALHRKYRYALPLYLIQLPELPHQYSLSRARNAGIRLASYDWVACLDADCIPGPSYFSSLHNHIDMTARPKPILTAERIFIDAAGLSASEIVANPGRLESAPRARSASNYHLVEDRRLPRLRLPAMANQPHPWDVIHSCNVVFWREDALSVGGYDESYDGYWGYEDIDFAFRMVSDLGCTPRYAKGCHVFHQERIGPDAWCATRSQKTINPNWERICRRIPGYYDYKRTLYKEVAGILI
jgi:glycosyltransferase involved in cell wall biosynthesis